VADKLAPRSAVTRAASPVFTGEVWSARVAGLVGPSAVSFVEFRDGACTRWHVHDGDQLLIIASGLAVIGTRDRRHEVAAGESVLIKAGEEHFHAAAPGGLMAHYSVLAGSHTEILEAVN
jgi:quercetin dioxygenase-like cupin family protein